MTTGRVEQKPARDRTCEVYLNLPAIALTGVIPNPHLNPSGFEWVLRHPRGFT
jgi:hypothetical protein